MRANGSLEWSRIANAFQEAVAALDELFGAIGPSGKDAEHLAPFIRQSRIGWDWVIEGYEGRPAIGGDQADNRQAARLYHDAQGWAFGALPQFY